MTREEFLNTLEDWLSQKGVFIILVILGVIILRIVLRVTLSNVVREAVKVDRNITKFEEEERERTVSSILNSVTTVFLMILALILIINRLGVDFGPLLAGASAVGFLIGFGAQDTVKDAVAGFFVITENQYNIGDVVELAGVSGTVEKITMRSTVLRNIDGFVHHVPNGKVDVATNKTSQFSRMHINIGVSYDTDIDKIEKVVNQVGKDLTEDKVFGEYIEEAPTFKRISDFTDTAMTVKIIGKTLPGKQWRVAGEFRKRIKIAFDKNNIERPNPYLIMNRPPQQESPKKA